MYDRYNLTLDGGASNLYDDENRVNEQFESLEDDLP
jgi:hypothetical protein